VNRKILATVLALAVVLLATPYIGMVNAGKGQEKLYFKLYIVGLPDYSTGEIRHTPDPDNGPFNHGRDVEWLPVDVLEVTIGSTTYYPDDVSYSNVLDADYNTETLVGHQRIRETVTFNDISGGMGTIEIWAIGSLAKVGVVFTGHGTGALEGVKVEGTTWAELISWPGVPPVRLAVTREGTVMGWP
jgi:hypothetical protein